MCCVCKRLCNTEKIVASSPTLSAYPSLPTLSAILLNRQVDSSESPSEQQANNKQTHTKTTYGVHTRDKTLTHMISSLASAGTDPPLKKRAPRNLPNGLHEKRKNKSLKLLLCARSCSTHSGTTYIYFFGFFLSLAG